MEPALFPALAIPVETKRHHECPDDHLEALQACLPKITKLLLIGWRASEVPFLQLLAKNLQRDLFVMAVTESGDGQKVIDKLKGAGITGKFLSFNGGGFSAYVLSQEVAGFLSR